MAAIMDGCFEGSASASRIVQPTLWRYAKLGSLKPGTVEKNCYRLTKSQLNGVPRSISHVAQRPSTAVKCRVCRPWAGRMERTLLLVNVSPVLTYSTTNRDRRNVRLACSRTL